MATRKPESRFLEGDEPDENEEENPEVRQERVAEAMASVIHRLDALARDAVSKRGPIERRWLDDLRLYHGRYDEKTEKNLEQAQGQKSRAFIPLARAKTNLWEAELGDRLFPADDKNYGIGPTPVPELVESAERAKQDALEADAEAERLTEQHNQQMGLAQEQAAATGQPPQMPGPGLLEQAEQKGEEALKAREIEAEARTRLGVAQKRAQAMETEIDDQLTECKYPSRCRDVISDACRLGPGVMKGPLFSAKPRRIWEQAKDDQGIPIPNVFQLKPVGQDKPEYVRVDPWNFFPDWNAQCIEDSEFELERHLPNKRQLRRMAKELSFDKKAVRELLEEGPGFGSSTDLDHLAQLRAITNDGEAVTGRYVLWEYHGGLEINEVADLLRGLGREEEAEEFEENHDPIEELRVVVYFCNGKLLKLAEEYPLDSGETLYSVFSFEKSEGSILGARGIPGLMADPLAALNAAWRMMLDNAALAVGPQVVVDKAQIEPEDGDWKLTGRKVWQRTGQDALGQQKPFETFDIPMRQDMLAGVIELAMRFIDEVTGLTLPGQMPDEPAPAAQTLGGLAIQQNSKNVVFRRVVKNFDDDLTTPNIRRLYDWNMQFSEKEEIKGDMKVEARGTSALLVKEIQSQHLMAITQNWSGHPIMGAALKVYDAMRMTLQSLSINPDDLLITKDEFERRLQDAQQAQPSPEQIRAEAAVKVAEIGAQKTQMQSDVDLQIADLNYETAVMKLAHDDQAHRDKLLAMLEDRREERAARSHEKQADRTAKERLEAVKIGVEQQREMRAEARGIPGVEASGKGIG